MNEELPAPIAVDSEPSNSGSWDQSRRSRARGRRELPTIDELLAQIINLNGMLVIGAISPQTATALFRGIKTVLDAQQRQQTTTGTTPMSEGLIERCRNDPSLIPLVEPFLTDEQMAQLFPGWDRHADGSA